jgi:26S proteasome non-ATPase regulatory subunit 9
METAKNLMSRKDAIQAELDSQYSILAANSSTLHTPLVDPQGFPRSDIDVYAVRHARVRIIELKNDMEAIVNDLAKALEIVYNPLTNGLVPEVSPAGTSAGGGNSTEKIPLGKVDGVVPGSPAAQAVSLFTVVLFYVAEP